jgi:hypothetical protein
MCLVLHNLSVFQGMINVENDGGITSTSLLKLEPTMGEHQHVIECFVGRSDVTKKVKLIIEVSWTEKLLYIINVFFTLELYGEEFCAGQGYEEEPNQEGWRYEYNY